MKNLVLILFVIVITVCFAEGILRFIEFIRDKEEHKVSDYRGFMVADEKVGWRMKPNFTFIDKKKEFEVTYQSNSSGYRDYEFVADKPDSVFRIFAFGDSFTFGAGVEGHEVWPKALEKLLNNENFENKFEVYNFGVGAYGNAQELLILKENLKYKPDLVLVELIVENRFVYESSSYGSALNRNIEFLDRGNKKHKDKDVKRKTINLKQKMLSFPFKVRAFLLKKSELYKRFEQLFGIQLRKYLGGLKASDDERMDYAWLVFEDIFRNFKTLSNEHGFPIIVIYYPYVYDAYSNNSSVYQKLCEILNPMDIDVINLVPGMYKNQHKKLYYPLDGHPTPIGQSLAVEEIFGFLKINNYMHGYVKDQQILNYINR